ncbi:MAG: hypothetical protein FCKEOINB_02217 [Nitrosomonas sp.]|nr:hypothetical protein [Nitrosomonas sp.]
MVHAHEQNSHGPCEAPPMLCLSTHTQARPSSTNRSRLQPSQLSSCTTPPLSRHPHHRRRTRVRRPNAARRCSEPVVDQLPTSFRRYMPGDPGRDRQLEVRRPVIPRRGQRCEDACALGPRTRRVRGRRVPRRRQTGAAKRLRPRRRRRVEQRALHHRPDRQTTTSSTTVQMTHGSVNDSPFAANIIPSLRVASCRDGRDAPARQPAPWWEKDTQVPFAGAASTNRMERSHARRTGRSLDVEKRVRSRNTAPISPRPARTAPTSQQRGPTPERGRPSERLLVGIDRR